MRRRRLLVLATYPRSAAATRFRVCAYFGELADRGVDAELAPFLDEESLRRLYVPGQRASKGFAIARALAGRVGLVLRARRYDGVFVQREAALVGPPVLERLLARTLEVPLVFDFDDAIWLDQASASQHPLAARLLKSPSKTNELLRMAGEVIAGSRHLAEHATRFADRVTVLPTVVSREAFRPIPGRLEGGIASRDGVPVIGWVGSHSTAAYLDLVVPALRELAVEGHRFRVRLVGAARTLDIDGVEVESVPWRQESEVADYQRIDVGIAPSPDDEWARGKCAFKQVQYMAVGAPMVSSAVGAANEILEHGRTAMLASTHDEWVAHLRALLTDQALRARLAQEGRTLVEERLCTEVQAPLFADVIERALG